MDRIVFGRKAADVLELKELIKSKKGHARIIAKIEKPEALLELDQIIEFSDGIMVARGDLGVEISFDQVPLIQISSYLTKAQIYAFYQ